MKNLPERLKKYRNKNKVKQSEIANYLGISQSAYALYESGQRTPPLEKLNKIADFFQVPPAYLMGWEEDQELDKVQVLIGKLKDNTIKRKVEWYSFSDKENPNQNISAALIGINLPTSFDQEKSYYCRVGNFLYGLLWVYDEKYVLHCAYPKKYADMNQFPFDESSNVKNTEMDFFIYTGSDEKNNALDDLASIVKERIKETGTVNDSLLTDMISALDNLE